MIAIGKWITIGKDQHLGLLKEDKHEGIRFRNRKIVVYIGIVVLKRIEDDTYIEKAYKVKK